MSRHKHSDQFCFVCGTEVVSPREQAKHECNKCAAEEPDYIRALRRELQSNQESEKQ